MGSTLLTTAPRDQGQEIKMRNYPKISVNTLVIVRRTVKSFNDSNERGPKTIRQAVIDGDLTNSSGTVRVCLTVAEGEHEGATAIRSNDGRWYASYDPLTENPDRSRRNVGL